MNQLIEEALTTRERQVAELLLTGCRNKQIAAQLGITPRTVKAHLSKMFLRFQIRGANGSGSRILLARKLLAL